jgi:hypothetical protein
LDIIVALDCIAIITAVIEVNIKGILEDEEEEVEEEEEEEDIAVKQRLITNGIRMIAVNIAINGSGLKSKYCPFEKGRVNKSIIPTATIKNIPHDITKHVLVAKDKELVL